MWDEGTGGTFFPSLGGNQGGGGGGSILSGLGSLAGFATGNPWIGTVASALGGLFGGGGDSASDMMEEQAAWQRHFMRWGPSYQMQGYRNAGLNPMLLMTKGVPLGAGPSMPQTQDDRSIRIQRIQTAIAAAQGNSAMQLQGAQTQLLEAQKAKTEAETLTELNRPENVSAHTSALAAQAPMHESQTALNVASTSLREAERLLTNENIHLANANTIFAHWHALTEKRSYELVQPAQAGHYRASALQATESATLPQFQRSQIWNQTQILKEELKGAVRRGDLEESKFAKIMGYIDRFTSSLNISGSAHLGIRR